MRHFGNVRLFQGRWQYCSQSEKYEIPKHQIRADSRLGFRIPGMVKAQVLRFILQDFGLGAGQEECELLESTLREQISIVHDNDTTPSLRKTLSNTQSCIATPVPELSTPCACATGPFAEYFDVSIGHICTMDLSVLQGLVPPSYIIGNNFKPVLPLPIEEFNTLHKQLVLDMLAAAEDVAADVMHYSIDTNLAATVLGHGRDLYSTHLTQTKSNTLNIGTHRQESTTRIIEEIKTHFWVTCMDKVAHTFVFICKPFAQNIVASHLTSRCYTPVPCISDTILEYTTKLLAFMKHHNITITLPDSLPYCYPTLKRHKCMDHKPTVLHECTLGWRKIVASVDTLTDWASESFSSGLQECKRRLFAYRHEQEKEFLGRTGIYLRHTNSVDSWINVCLNLPTETASRHRGFNCDLAKCFDNVPHQGDDGILTRIPIGLRTVFMEACPDRKLYIPLDSDHQPCYTARFRRSRPPPFGKAVQYIEFDLDDFIRFFTFCMDYLLVG